MSLRCIDVKYVPLSEYSSVTPKNLLMTMDQPSFQLQGNLRDSLRGVLASRRPILSHLNADTTWLLQLPYPAHALRPPGRSHFNVLLDPWFRGPQSDLARWFSSQWHVIESSVQTINELNECLRDCEQIAQNEHDRASRHASHVGASKSYIDAVVVSHEFTDHCNQHTLLELDPATPIFATKEAAILIRSWRYFKLVLDTPPFSADRSDWRDTSLDPLPTWLGISRIANDSDSLYYHSAIMVSFNLNSKSKKRSSEVSPAAEAVVYTPHGIHAEDLRCLPAANPPLRTTALLHGLHDIRISAKQLNLGAHNGLKAQRICDAKYWVSTHDEVKKATGLITPFLRRHVLTLKEALDEESKWKGGISNSSTLADLRDVTFAELMSGESLFLV